jgi:hypothetical protein
LFFAFLLFWGFESLADESAEILSPPTAVAPFDEAQAKAHQNAWAKHLGQRVELTNSVGMKLKLIPPGTVTMGKRQTTWKTFIKSHWDVLAAIDFTTIEVWTKGGLVTHYLLFVMELATRRVHLAACTPTLGDNLMRQIARNLTDTFDGFLKDKRYVLMDPDANLSCAFRTILKEAGVIPVRLPARSPNLNSHLDRFHLSIKSE